MTAIPTFYWYDYETFGIHPALDRPAQFAGVRTDMELNPVGDELLIYNRLTDDYLPDPGAALVTNIGPESVKDGLNERDFIQLIKQQLSHSGTCNVGYNNIRFDDEFTRFTLFRNFLDAYEHEWRDGNSRWDLLDVVRLTRALRPAGIEWPFHPDGNASNRLEDITKANCLAHTQAHDALSDVHATIAVARLIKQNQPKLFDYAFLHRDKTSVATSLNLRERKPVIHVSGMIPGIYGHTAIVMPIAKHPSNKNGVIVLDLRDDPAQLETLSVDDIARRLFTPTGDLPANETRLAIKTVHINRAPVIVPLTTLDQDAAQRLTIDKAKSLQHRDTVLGFADLPARISQAFQSNAHKPIGNVDASLYSGGFFSSADKQRFTRIREADANALATLSDSFDDPRVEEMLFRYRARNYPDTLSTDERRRWSEHCTESLTATVAGVSAQASFREKLSAEQWPEGREALRIELLNYADELDNKWSLSVVLV